jgi:small subunit ribosomal protein S4
LEHRLDNVRLSYGVSSITRSGSAVSKSWPRAREWLAKVSIPSYRVRIGDIISVREGSKKSAYFTNLVPQWLPKYEAPSWIQVDKDQMTATVKGNVSPEESGVGAGDLQAIIEFYSR